VFHSKGVSAVAVGTFLDVLCLLCAVCVDNVLLLSVQCKNDLHKVALFLYDVSVLLPTSQDHRWNDTFVVVPAGAAVLDWLKLRLDKVVPIA
jgi:hypothetical protein